MEEKPRSSYRHQLLQAWCSLLTVAMVIMAVHLATMNQKPAEVGVPTPETINSTHSGPIQRQIQEPLKSGSSHSFIQLHQRNGRLSVDLGGKESLTLGGKSITVQKNGSYFFYAQVTFREELRQERRVLVERTGFHDNKTKKLAEGIYPASTENSVWLAKIVKLRPWDRVSINITGEILNDHTYWGVIELQ
ncbi:lymphotoxin-alpha isoform X2 [Oreochromis niloticus]|uniref:Uncharacterized LOC102075727 n=3 Tax=Oreochromis TaxID=8139 RepID=A0A669CSB9_ORENI|nr:uncharacterized protein LOC102075727 isoform X2 [Oreochromis niloticus]XP_039475192.1 uncharacterized protein LOC120442574 isoform X3 [Oreochromis aureus]